MASLIENKVNWGETYDWERLGEEWSDGYGNSEMQWFSSIYPRILHFLPAKKILEIGSGYGRWTYYLRKYCDELHIVDFSENCMDFCKKRFKNDSKIIHHLNDGMSLDMIQSDSIDFVFSFDSLVHADTQVITSYLSQLNRILKFNGIAFIHHSNLGEFSGNKKTIEDWNPQWRDETMSYLVFSEICKKNSLRVVSQELLNWNSKDLIDCISVVVKDSIYNETVIKLFKNHSFMEERKYIALLFSIYRENTKEKKENKRADINILKETLEE